MDRDYYQNSMYHQGFIYQHPGYTNNEYANPVNYQTPERVKSELPLATIYVKPQVYKGISSPANALKQGTAFAELYRPFKGGTQS